MANADTGPSRRDRAAAEDVVERVYLAVRQLAIGKGSVCDRLVVAGITLFPLQLREFPTQLQPEFDSIMTSLTRFESEYGEGRIKATMRRIRHSTGQRIAVRIFELYAELQSLRGSSLL